MEPEAGDPIAWNHTMLNSLGSSRIDGRVVSSVRLIISRVLTSLDRTSILFSHSGCSHRGIRRTAPYQVSRTVTSLILWHGVSTADDGLIAPMENFWRSGMLRRCGVRWCSLQRSKGDLPFFESAEDGVACVRLHVPNPPLSRLL